jgi:hypothetical protein
MRAIIALVFAVLLSGCAGTDISGVEASDTMTAAVATPWGVHTLSNTAALRVGDATPLGGGDTPISQQVADQRRCMNFYQRGDMAAYQRCLMGMQESYGYSGSPGGYANPGPYSGGGYGPTYGGVIPSRMYAGTGMELCKAPDSETPQIMQAGRCQAIYERYRREHYDW